MTTASTVSLKTPGALVASIPYLLGFQPADDLIAVWLKDGKILVTQRADLDPSLANPKEFVAPLNEHAPDEVVLIAYGSVNNDQQQALFDAADEIARIRDFLWVRDGRWGSQICNVPQCCTPQGKPIEVAAGAEFVVMGNAPLATREDLADECRPQGTKKAVTPLPKGERASLDETRDTNLALLNEALGDPPTGMALLRLGRSLQDIRVRDTILWDITSEDDYQRAYDLFSAICRASHPSSVAPVAVCAALAAWLMGDGARANVACEYAREANPDYSLLHLVEASLRAGLPPTSWSDAMKNLTRDDCRHGTR